jgi:hypothetical protein
MGRIAVAIVSLAVGTPLGFVLLAAFCIIPGLAFSVACGHNAPIWIPLFLPAAIGGNSKGAQRRAPVDDATVPRH